MEFLEYLEYLGKWLFVIFVISCIPGLFMVNYFVDKKNIKQKKFKDLEKKCGKMS